jgi:hypothetical protein
MSMFSSHGFNKPVVSSRLARPLKALAVASVIGAAALAATPAQAWWHGGVFIGVPPVVIGAAPYPYYYPPYYYPPAYYPPAYYPPYPYAYPPPASGAPAQPQSNGAPGNGTAGGGKVAYGASCYAGVYHCAAPAYTPIGETCSCPGIGAPSYGSVQ